MWWSDCSNPEGQLRITKWQLACFRVNRTWVISGGTLTLNTAPNTMLTYLSPDTTSPSWDGWRTPTSSHRWRGYQRYHNRNPSWWKKSLWKTRTQSTGAKTDVWFSKLYKYGLKSLYKVFSNLRKFNWVNPNNENMHSK